MSRKVEELVAGRVMNDEQRIDALTREIMNDKELLRANPNTEEFRVLTSRIAENQEILDRLYGKRPEASA